MEDKKIIEEMARLEGLHFESPLVYLYTAGSARFRQPSGHEVKLPDYLTAPHGHGHCQRVIDGMDDILTHRCFNILCDLMGLNESCENDYRAFKATPRQKCEAILKACGKWEES